MMLLPLAAVLSLTFFVETTDAVNDFSCIDLSPYVSNEKNREHLEVFRNGGDIIDDSPVFFDIPRWNMRSSDTVNFCLENIPIPRSVRGVTCLGVTNDDGNPDPSTYWNNCFIAIGTRGVGDDQTDSCKIEGVDDGLRSCFQCVCSGSEFGTGLPNRTVVDACGPPTKEWSTVCPDVQNGRGYGETIGGGPSNYSSVQFSICPQSSNNCGDVCRVGGSQAPFKAAVQWITDVQDQCFDRPFVASGAQFATASLLVAFAFMLIGTLAISL